MFTKKVLAIGVSTAILTATLAMAQFGAIIGVLGGGLPVFDGANLGEKIMQTAKLIEQIALAKRTFDKITDQFDHMKRQAKALTSGRMNFYRAAQLVWKEFRASDYYNRNSDWQRAVTVGVDAAGAWRRITRAPDPYLRLASEMEDIAKNDFATVELQDGAAVNTIDLVGRVRMAGTQRSATLAQLENDSFSDDAELQSEAAQLNKVNALLIFQSKQTMDQNQLLTNMAEMQLLRLKQERDAKVYAINEAVYSQRRGAYYMTDTEGGPSQAVRDFSISTH